MSDKELPRLRILAKGTKCFVTCLPSLEGKDCSDNILENLVECINDEFPNVIFMLLVADLQKSAVKAIANVPTDNEFGFIKEKWLEYCNFTITGKQPETIIGEIISQEPFKYKDQLCSKAFEYLRKCNILEELESDDENDMPDFDW